MTRAEVLRRATPTPTTTHISMRWFDDVLLVAIDGSDGGEGLVSTQSTSSGKLMSMSRSEMPVGRPSDMAIIRSSV